MFFKNWMSGCFILSLILGCAKRGTPDHVPIEVKLQGTGGCISNINREITNFTNGEASPEEIRSFWQCLSSSIGEFEQLTAGDANGDYSRESLRHFIEHYFYTSKHISDDVLASMMQIKRIFLSGNETVVTPEELKHLSELFSELSAMSLDIQPYVGVLFRRKTAASDAEIRAASAGLERARLRLGTWLARENQTWSFAQITQTVNAVAQWVQTNGKDSAAMHTLRQAALIMPELKRLMIGGDQTAITGEDWLLLTRAGDKGWFLYLAAANGFDENLDAAFNRGVLPESAAGFIDLLAASAVRHPAGEIPLQEFKNLYAKLEQTDWLPTAIKAPGLTAATEWFVRRLLGDGVRQPTGLSADQIAKFHARIDSWIALLNRPADDSSSEVQAFNKMLASSRPMSWDGLGRMQFPDRLPTDWTPAARKHMVWPYVMIGWLEGAYGSTAGVTEDQATLAAQEILPLLQNFGWLMSTKLTIGKRILREADLFTLGSNGDGLLDINEGVRYLAFIVSSYRSAQVWLETAAKTCPDRQADCVRSAALDPNGLPFSAMPRLQRVMATWKPGQFFSYMQNAEQIALGGPEALKFTTGDLLETFQLFEYIEVFYELYDKDFNEQIDLSEAIAAYTVYGPTLGRLLPSSDLGFFTFMMKYGDTPFTMFGGQIAYNYWRWHTESWALAADRNILMGILSQLAKLTSQ